MNALAKITSSKKSAKSPAAKEGPVQGFLTYRLKRLDRLLDRQSRRLLTSGHGLSVMEWRALNALASRNRCTVREISELMVVPKSQVSRTLADLVSSGYAKRTSDPDDRRNAFFTITAKGTTLWKKVLPETRKRNESLLQILDADQRKALIGAIDKLSEHLKADG